MDNQSSLFYTKKYFSRKIKLQEGYYPPIFMQTYFVRNDYTQSREKNISSGTASNIVPDNSISFNSFIWESFETLLEKLK